VTVIAAALLLSMAGFLTGCGKKGDPLSRANAKAPPVTLSLKNTAEGIVVTWPAATGRPETTRFILEKSGGNAGKNDCPGCPQPFVVVAEMSPAEVCGETNGPWCRYTDRDVVEGQRYGYRLQACDEKGLCKFIAHVVDRVFSKSGE
jgi:predicted small lipoprotein YifL